MLNLKEMQKEEPEMAQLTLSYGGYLVNLVETLESA